MCVVCHYKRVFFCFLHLGCVYILMSPRPPAGKVVCGACGGKCSGEVLRVSDKYFHTACFTCRACAASLAKGGFFCKDSYYYCPQVRSDVSRSVTLSPGRLYCLQVGSAVSRSVLLSPYWS